MSLAEDLLAQAHMLASLDRGKPRQANLRRAVSAAYYASFHLLVADAARMLAPPKPKGLVDRVGRAFQHGEMKQVCNMFLRRPLPGVLGSLMDRPVSTELQTLAFKFVELQEARHSADYDVSLTLSRSTVQAIISTADNLSVAWRSIRRTDEANVFLAALAFGVRWAR